MIEGSGSVPLTNGLDPQPGQIPYYLYTFLGLGRVFILFWTNQFRYLFMFIALKAPKKSNFLQGQTLAG
jgi:hypothetical protein